MSSLTERVWEHSKKNPAGFTVNADLQTITTGYAVAVRETQGSFGRDGLQRVVEYAETHNTAIGGWRDTATGLYYFDAIVVILDREEAIQTGKANGQIAIYDIGNDKEIRL